MARNGVKNSSLFKKCETGSLGVVFSVEFKNYIDSQIKINFKGVSEPVFQKNAKFLILSHLDFCLICLILPQNRHRYANSLETIGKCWKL